MDPVSPRKERGTEDCGDEAMSILGGLLGAAIRQLFGDRFGWWPVVILVIPTVALVVILAFRFVRDVRKTREMMRKL